MAERYLQSLPKGQKGWGQPKVQGRLGMMLRRVSATAEKALCRWDPDMPVLRGETEVGASVSSHRSFYPFNPGVWLLTALLHVVMGRGWPRLGVLAWNMQANFHSHFSLCGSFTI